MNLEVTLIPYGQICQLVPSLMRYLTISETWTNGRANVDDIVKFLLNGQMHLWAVYDPDSNTVYGYVITEIKQYPQKRMLVAQYCAGEPNHMQYVQDKAFGVLDEVAVKAGCDGIEFFGRPSWRPYAKQYGYAVQTVVYEKHFEVKS